MCNVCNTYCVVLRYGAELTAAWHVCFERTGSLILSPSLTWFTVTITCSIAWVMPCSRSQGIGEWFWAGVSPFIPSQMAEAASCASRAVLSGGAVAWHWPSTRGEPAPQRGLGFAGGGHPGAASRWRTLAVPLLCCSLARFKIYIVAGFGIHICSQHMLLAQYQQMLLSGIKS